jgi:hypothetical protein
MNQAQINNLIAQAQRRLDQPLPAALRLVPTVAQPALRAPPVVANNAFWGLGAANGALFQIMHDFNAGG